MPLIEMISTLKAGDLYARGAAEDEAAGVAVYGWREKIWHFRIWDRAFGFDFINETS